MPPAGRSAKTGPTAVEGSPAAPSTAALWAGYRINLEAFRAAALAKQLFSTRAQAAAAGLSWESVSRLYAGGVSLGSYRAAAKLAKALDLKWPDDVLVKDAA